MRRLVWLFLLALVSTAAAQDLQSPTAIEGRLRTDAEYLASDELEGRGPRTKGLDLAADHIAAEFKRIGLNVRAYGGSPFHEFQTYRTPTLEKHKAAFTGPDGGAQALAADACMPLSLGKSGEVDAPLVFVGYGITAEDVNYDDYAGVDVRGKIVIALRHEPQQADPQSPFNGKSNSAHAYLGRKIENAAAHGAVGIVFVTDGVSAEKEGADKLLAFRVKGTPEKRMITLHVTRATVDRWLRLGEKSSLKQLEESIDADLKPQSFALNVRLQAQVTMGETKQSLKNVVAVSPGQGALAEETLVIGAHYDHLGRGSFGSLAPWTNAIHNGADDNASGTCCLMETARQLMGHRWGGADRRRIVFIAFSAEEMGLIGSERYVRSPLFPIEDTVAMLNFDMVGRLGSDNAFQLHGVGTAEEFGDLTAKIAERHSLKLRTSSSGYGPSDHASFYERGVPVLHFFTGLHRDYHRPSDDVDKLDIPGIRRIALMASDVAVDLATREKRVQPQKAGFDLGDLLGDLTGDDKSTTWLGVRATNVAEPPGLSVTQIFPKSPAQAAGLREGDILQQLNGKPISKITELQSLVQAAKPGDTMRVRLLREGIALELEVKLQGR